MLTTYVHKGLNFQYMGRHEWRSWYPYQWWISLLMQNNQKALSSFAFVITFPTLIISQWWIWGACEATPMSPYKASLFRFNFRPDCEPLQWTFKLQITYRMSWGVCFSNDGLIFIACLERYGTHYNILPCLRFLLNSTDKDFCNNCLVGSVFRQA